MSMMHAHENATAQDMIHVFSNPHAEDTCIHNPDTVKAAAMPSRTRSPEATISSFEQGEEVRGIPYFTHHIPPCMTALYAMLLSSMGKWLWLTWSVPEPCCRHFPKRTQKVILWMDLVN